MIQLSPDFENLRIEKKEGSVKIFCSIRKRWVDFTPEEMVRQVVVLWMIKNGSARANIAVEKQIKVGDRIKRFDIVVYDAAMQPYILVECKNPDVSITDHTLEQALRYLIPLRSPYLFLTNGTDLLMYATTPHLHEITVYPAS